MLKHDKNTEKPSHKQLAPNDIRGLFESHIDALLGGRNPGNATTALCTLIPDHRELLPYLFDKIVPPFLNDEKCNLDVFDALVRIGRLVGARFDGSYLSPEEDLNVVHIGRLEAVGLMIDCLPSKSTGDIVRFGGVGALVNLLDGDFKECAEFAVELKQSSSHLSKIASGSFDAVTNKPRTKAVVLLCAIAELDPDLGAEACRNIDRRFHFLTSLVKPTSDNRNNTTRENKTIRAIHQLLGIQNAVNALSGLDRECAFALREAFLNAAPQSNTVSAELIGGMLASIADGRSGQESEIVSQLRSAVDADFTALEKNGPLDPHFKARCKNLAGNIRVFCDVVSREVSLAERYVPEIMERFERSIRDIPSRDANLAIADGLVDVAATRAANEAYIVKLGIPTRLVDGLRSGGWVGNDNEKRGAAVRCLTGLVQTISDARSAHDVLQHLVVNLKDFPVQEQEGLPPFVSKVLSGFRDDISNFYVSCFSILSVENDVEVATVLVDMATTMLMSRSLNLDDASNIHQCATNWIRGPLNLGMTRNELKKTEIGKSLNQLNSEIMKRAKLRHRAIGKLAGDSISKLNELP